MHLSIRHYSVKLSSTILKLNIPSVTKFMWATEEYAIIRFKSVCLIALKEAYMIPKTDSK